MARVRGASGMTMGYIQESLRALASIPGAHPSLQMALERMEEMQGRINSLLKPSRVLAVGAHPDDVEFGAAGLLQRYAERRIVVLTAGGRGGLASVRQAEAAAAAQVIGAELSLHDLPDTALSLQAATSVLEAEIGQYHPDVVLTMSRHETHQDHCAVYQATLIATRDLVGTILSYLTPSAAEGFRPNWYAVLTAVEMEKKLAAIGCHASQNVRPYMRPEYATGVAHYWAQVTRCPQPFVEPYELVRHNEVP